MNLHEEASVTLLIFSFLSISFRNILFCIVWLALALRELGIEDPNEKVLSLHISSEKVLLLGFWVGWGAQVNAASSHCGSRCGIPPSREVVGHGGVWGVERRASVSFILTRSLGGFCQVTDNSRIL